jgi:hypothetical protein
LLSIGSWQLLDSLLLQPKKTNLGKTRTIDLYEVPNTEPSGLQLTWWYFGQLHIYKQQNFIDTLTEG